MKYEKLKMEALNNDVEIFERSMNVKIKGLYADNIIWINKSITQVEKLCVLAEELGHHYTTVGDIIKQNKLENIKQEKQARKWAWNKLVSPLKLIESFEYGCKSKYEIAEYLNITEGFLEDGLKFYKEKYGTSIKINKKYTLILDPLSVYKNS